MAAVSDIPTVVPGESRTLVVVPTVAGIDPARVTATTWTPKGTNAAISWTPPSTIAGVAVGLREFSVTLTLAAIDGGAIQNVTYLFEIACVGGPRPAAPIMLIPPQP
jgi:hypothetical protein